MRKKDLEKLEKPYDSEENYHRRLQSMLGADVPHAGVLEKQIFDDLDLVNFGLPAFNSLPDHERILISDYLYQCVSSIELNLIEARLHYLEWLGQAEKLNERYADIVSIRNGSLY